MTQLPNPPQCVGTYEPGHQICDGIPGAALKRDEVPCAWRDHCAGLKAFCVERGHQPSRVLETLNNRETLVALCESQIEKHGIKEGKATKNLPVEKPAEPEKQPEPQVVAATPPQVTDVMEIAKAQASIDSALAKRAAGTSRRRVVQVQKEASPIATYDPAVRAQEKQASREADRIALESGAKTREQLQKENTVFAFPPGTVKIDYSSRKRRDLLQELDEQFRASFDGYSLGRPKRVVVNPGTFYSVRRGDSLKWCMISAHGRDLNVVVAKFDSESESLEVQLLPSPEKLAASCNQEVAILRPINRRASRMRSQCHGVGRDEIKAICQALRTLCDNGDLI